MKNITKYILLTAAFFILLLNPETASRAVINSMKISVSRIIPSIFPFMVFSEFIIFSFGSRSFKSKSCDNVLPTVALPLIFLGNVSGFPVGAKNSAKLYESGMISEKQALICAILSGNASVSFVVSFVGANLFLSKKLGIALYFSQLAASVITALICNYIVKDGECHQSPLFFEEHKNRSFEEAFIDSVSGAAISCLTVTAFITTFGIIIEYACILCSKISITPAVVALISSLLEISNGCLHSASLTPPYSYVICAFAIGFSGLSVMFQSMSFFSKSKIKSLPFISFKLIQGIISSMITFFLFKYVSISFETSEVINKVSAKRNVLDVVLLSLCVLYILLVLKKFTLKRSYRKERT